MSSISNSAKKFYNKFKKGLKILLFFGFAGSSVTAAASYHYDATVGELMEMAQYKLKSDLGISFSDDIEIKDNINSLIFR